MAKRKEAERQEKDVTEFDVRLTGLAPIMFDRFISLDENENANRPVEDKLYLKNGKVVLPGENILSFLCAELGGKSCACILEKRQAKTYRQACAAFLAINADTISFMRGGAPIAFHGFSKSSGCDANSGMYIAEHTARVKKTGGLIVPLPKRRPVLPLPWELCFSITLFGNADLKADRLERWFREGGIRIGLGTFRPRYGRFTAELTEKE